MAIDSARKNGLLGRTNAEIGYIDAQAAEGVLRPKLTANAELDGSRARHGDEEDSLDASDQPLPSYLGCLAPLLHSVVVEPVVEIYQSATFLPSATFSTCWCCS